MNRGKGTDCKGSILLPDAGSGAWPAFDGCANVRDAEIVSVTINYRLGVLGFLGLPALSAANSSNGNWALMVRLPGQGYWQGRRTKQHGSGWRVIADAEQACLCCLAPADRTLLHVCVYCTGPALGPAVGPE